MIEIKKLCKSFSKRQILKDITVKIEKGELVLLEGHNGSGKTTLFKAISGQIPICSGEIYIDKKNVTQMTFFKRAKYISTLFQETQIGCIADMTVKKNIALSSLRMRNPSLGLASKNFPKIFIEQLLEKLNNNLNGVLDLKMSELSGGQRQIFNFIMCLLSKPRLLLLDEPTAALDPKSKRSFSSILNELVLKEKIPTLIITHEAQFFKGSINKVLKLS